MPLSHRPRSIILTYHMSESYLRRDRLRLMSASNLVRWQVFRFRDGSVSCIFLKVYRFSRNIFAHLPRRAKQLLPSALHKRF